MRAWLPYAFVLRRSVASALVLAILLVLLYACVCTQAGSLDGVGEERRVVLFGKVRGGFGDPAGQCVYVLEDPSGAAFILSEHGTPRENAFVIVWGAKHATDEGRPLVVEQRRAGAF